MSGYCHSFWIAAPWRGEIRRLPLSSTFSSVGSAPGEAEVIVQALWSGVSRGTETLIFKGAVPPSEYHRMRAPFQEGEFPAPVKYGYCMVGRILEGPSEIVGREVFCLHPHQDRFIVPRAAVHVLPTNVPASRAVLAANLETALNGLWDAGVLPGDRVSVIGAGSVGCLVAWLAARIPGCDVELVDINPRRAAIAAALGARFALPEAARGEANIVIHASGSEVGATLALRVAGFEATVVEMSWYGSRTVSLPLGEAFHSRRLVLKSSQVGQVAAVRRAHHSLNSRLQLAISLLTDAALDGLIESEGRFIDLPQALQDLSSGASDAIMHRVRYD